MAEAARILGEKRVCKVEVDVSLPVVFYCLEREELQTALRDLAQIVSHSNLFESENIVRGFVLLLTIAYCVFLSLLAFPILPSFSCRDVYVMKCFSVLSFFPLHRRPLASLRCGPCSQPMGS